uniref:Uncharacterized protein n=1 Tax=Physcomitrium patens TaxID=3218 RepID=A0A2K1J7Q2_PHYPA|nr:hypothetical protein PHYPA_020658 [Physcomitrium patens]
MQLSSSFKHYKHGPMCTTILPSNYFHAGRGLGNRPHSRQDPRPLQPDTLYRSPIEFKMPRMINEELSKIFVPETVENLLTIPPLSWLEVDD